METAEKKKEKKELKTLNPMLILVAILLIVAIASYIVPGGSYDRVYNEAMDREILDPNSFHYVDKNPITPFTLLMSLTLGIQNAAYIIAFLLIIGGMFAILDGSGAIHAGMGNAVKKMKGKELLMIPVCMIIFGCGSAFCANFEEFLAFVPLVLACCLTMGFDSLTAVGIIFCAIASGYGGAITNAFTTGVAQSIAGLPMFSGMGLRVVLFIVLLSVSIGYVMWHATRVKKNPQLSPTYDIDRINAENVVLDVANIEPMTKRQILVLLTLLAGIIGTVYGVVVKGFYIDELAAIFLLTGIVGGIVGGLKPGQICDEFVKGCANMLLPCLMIGLANAIIVLLNEASIIDTIIHSLSSLLNNLPASLLACGMFCVQSLLNLLVPSGSGQAAISMPLMAPLADMIGITRQTAVLAFQMGSTFTDVIGPTSGEVLVALAMCKVPYSKWVKYLLPLFAIWCVIACGFLVFAVQSNYGPF